MSGPSRRCCRRGRRRSSSSSSSCQPPPPPPMLLLYAAAAAAAAFAAPGRASAAELTSSHSTPALGDEVFPNREAAETALRAVGDAASESLGELCMRQQALSLHAPFAAEPRLDTARRQLDLAAAVLQEVGVPHHGGGLLDAVARAVLPPDGPAAAARVLALNASSGAVLAAAAWRRWRGGGGSISYSATHGHGGGGGMTYGAGDVGAVGVAGAGAAVAAAASVAGPDPDPAYLVRPGKRPDPLLPWFEDAASSPTLRSPKFQASPPGRSYRGWWTFPYWSCATRRWTISYSVAVPPSTVGAVGRRGAVRGFLALDVDLSSLDVNQCDRGPGPSQPSEVAVFRGTHKCHLNSSYCMFRPGVGWVRGGYQCVCRPGFFSPQQKPFNGSLVEAAWEEEMANESTVWSSAFRCRRCAPGCHRCTDSRPCLAVYNWPFRVALLTVSCLCVCSTLLLVGYVYRHRRLKVFKVASPIFLGITLLGCAIMYLEMAAIFPVLDTYSCIATKWSRHLGFCITYTALLMKTWRVSLTYRVKSAHKVKLTDKQLLQWMFPILLVMLIYLGTWTLSAPPAAEQILDARGLRFRQCTYNWWDHALAIGEVLFLAWGIRVCYNVRHAESLFNEARLITYAIYNIAIVNLSMVAFHLFILPHAGPDIKYLLGFIRTQLSTTVTVALVFGPKIVRVLRGQGDQWDNRARARGVTASFSLNGIGLVPEETTDLYQENEELKEEIQKLAAQIEFMKIVHMEVHNRHLRPKPGGYFNAASLLGSPPSRLQGSAATPSTPGTAISGTGLGAAAASAGATGDGSERV